MATIHLKRIDDDYQFVTTDETGQTLTMDIPEEQCVHGNGVSTM